MKLLAILFAVTGMAGLAWADQPGEDQRALAGAAAARPQSQAPAAAPTESAPAQGREPASAEEEAARAEATVALVKLELVMARKELREHHPAPAARKAVRALNLIKQLPTGIDASEYELQAEGILAKAAKAGVNVDAIRHEPVDVSPEALPPREHDRNLDAKAREAAKLSREYSGSASDDVYTGGDQRVLRERALRRQAGDKYGYHPAKEIVDRKALRVRNNERLYYQAALEGAYRDSEVRELVGVDESRVIPQGEVSYPPDWPEKMKKRAQYEGGMIARSPSWYDKDGREWYIGVYDINDLIYVPPDFALPLSMDPRVSVRESLDRDALRWQSDIFRGSPEDLAAGIPLLRFFGGIDDYALRGPKYSLARQQQIVQLIQAFTEPTGGKAVIIQPGVGEPPAPPPGAGQPGAPQPGAGQPDSAPPDPRSR